MKGLAFSYGSELKVLAAGSADNQTAWLEQLTSSVSLLKSRVTALGQIDPVTKFVEDCLKMQWKLLSGPSIRTAHHNFLVSLVTANLEYCKSVFRRLFSLLIPGEFYRYYI